MAYNLVCLAKAILAAKGKARNDRKELDRAIDAIKSAHPAYANYKHATLRRVCFGYWDSSPPAAPKESMVPLCISMAHKLGLWGDDAHKLVAEFVAAADGNEIAVVEYFKLAAKKKHYSDSQKIEWLWKQVPKLKGNPDRRPVRRVDKEDRPKRDLALRLIRGAPNQRANNIYIRQKTGWTRDAVAKLLQYLREDEEIICTEKPGTFTVPGGGAPHVTRREALRTLMAPSGREWTRPQILKEIGGLPGPIDSALHNLRGEGEIDSPRRGVYKWATLAARQAQ